MMKARHAVDPTLTILKKRARRFLYNLLMPSLKAAFSLPQMYHFAFTVTEYLCQ